MKKALTVLLVLISLGLYAQKRIVVAQDGSGNFTTVQQAINATPDKSETATVIFIKKGLYKEKLTVPANKQNLHFVGEDKNATILSYDDYHAKKDSAGKEIGTSGSASIHIYGNGFSAENITFQNTAGPTAGQAVAVWVAGDNVSFKNCRFLGNQDTLYTNGYGSHQYYKDCYIEGTVDFIFGASTAWFQNCDIYCKTAGCVTAASTPDSVKFGYVFKDCKIEGSSAAIGRYFLGRPWRPYAKVVFINCDLGNQIRSDGWDNWNNVKNEATAYYAEYKNKGPGFAPDKRVGWAHQLTDEEAKDYTINNALKGWNPEKGR